jgi:putative membrane protein
LVIATENPLAFVAIALLAAAAAFAGEPTNADIAFVQSAMQSELGEIALSRIAVDSARSASIRSFARQMVQEHARSKTALAVIAAHQQITLPDGPDNAHAALARDLANLHDSQFDRRYLQAMQDDHHRLADFLRHSETAISDPRLLEYIAAALPVAEAHAGMADRLRVE